MSIWTEVLDDGTPRLDCSMKIGCEFHPDTEMEVVLVKPLMFPLRKNGEEYSAYAVDIHTKCPLCGKRSLLGVAVSKELYDEILPE